MKNILLILSLTLSVTLFGQYNKEYYILELNTINDAFSKRLESYATNFSHEMSRNSTIDSVAKLRNSYFISVMQETSNNGKTFYSMIDSIPDGKRGHDECFGNPRYFSAAKIEYPESFPVFNDLGLEVNGEIMYQVIRSYIIEAKCTDIKGLVQIAVNDMKKNYKVNKLSERFLKSYQNSSSHNDIIKRLGDGKYGSSTMVIVSERKLSNGKWAYEVLIRNVIEFTAPIDRKNKSDTIRK